MKHSFEFLKLLCAGLALATFVSLGAPRTAFAQDVDIENQYETWLGGFFSGPIAGDFSFFGDVHYRAYDNGTPDWILVRPSIGYRFAPGMFAVLGYAWTPRFSSRNGNGYTDEHRLFEQWHWDFDLGSPAVRMQLRTRFEQRLRTQAAFEIGLRVRQMVRLAVGLDEAREFLFVVWDEIFFDLNDTTATRYQYAGFGQNRIFAGLAWQAVPSTLRFELGYFNQWIRRPESASGDLMNHAAMLNTYVNWR